MHRRSNSFNGATLLTETDGWGDNRAMGSDGTADGDRRDGDGWFEGDGLAVRVFGQSVGR